MSKTPRTTSTIIDGPAGALEALVDEVPANERIEHVAVVCHPHPLFGGSMSNKVTHILARTFNALGAPAVRFNFRGVGASEGTHDDGKGETDDVVAVLEWAPVQWPSARIWLAGFSFGAAMALRASLRRPVERLVTVAPALRWLTLLENKVPSCPWLIVQGDRDELVNVDAVRAWSAKLSHPPELRVLTGAEHFFHGRLNELSDTVTHWIAQ